MQVTSMHDYCKVIRNSGQLVVAMHKINGLVILPNQVHPIFRSF